LTATTNTSTSETSTTITKNNYNYKKDLALSIKIWTFKRNTTLDSLMRYRKSKEKDNLRRKTI
jgi:hypothetical protein